MYNICLTAAYWTTVDNSRHYKSSALTDETSFRNQYLEIVFSHSLLRNKLNRFMFTFTLIDIWSRKRATLTPVIDRIFNLVVRRKWWRNFSIYILQAHRKQIYAVILKRNIEVTSSTCYLYGNFLSYDSCNRAYIYARIYEFKFSE